MNSRIKGNIKNRKDFEVIVQSNNVLHSYLLLGKEGIGKKEISKEFAKKILCENPSNENCNCKSCTCFDSNNHPDIQIINEDGQTIKIETIREMIKSVYEKPILSQKKIFIINDAEKMTKEAQNSLLKTLEEPPEYVVIMLVTSNADLLLTTIKSRCTKIVFERLTKDEINQILTENNITDNISDEMFEIFDGSASKAIRILQNKEMYIQLDKFVDSIESLDKIDFLTKTKSIFVKEEINEALDYLLLKIFSIGKRKKSSKYLNCTNHIQETINRIKANSNFDMSIDYMLLKIWEEVNENNCRD